MCKYVSFFSGVWILQVFSEVLGGMYSKAQVPCPGLRNTVSASHLPLQPQPTLFSQALAHWPLSGVQVCNQGCHTLSLCPSSSGVGSFSPFLSLFTCPRDGYSDLLSKGLLPQSFLVLVSCFIFIALLVLSGLWVWSLSVFYGLNVCVLSKLIFWRSALMPCDGIWRWALWEVIWSWGWSPHEWD